MVKRVLIVIVIVAAIAAHVNARELAIRGIHSYQRSLSPIAAVLGARCRFEVSCSHYAEAAIAREGLMRGGWKAVKRIARCNPFMPPGTRD